MITDALKHADRYAALHRLLPGAFEYLASTDLVALAAGTYELDGRRLYAVVQDYVTKRQELGAWESHRCYIDLQVVARGTERIGYAPGSRMRAGAYDEARDVQPLSGGGDFVTVQAGDFVLLWPDEAHMPGIATTEPAAVRKIVVKIAAS